MLEGINFHIKMVAELRGALEAISRRPMQLCLILEHNLNPAVLVDQNPLHQTHQHIPVQHVNLAEPLKVFNPGAVRGGVGQHFIQLMPLRLNGLFNFFTILGETFAEDDELREAV